MPGRHLSPRVASFPVAELEPRTLHSLILQTVIPRPIAWVSTRSRDGRDNVAPFSFFNAFSAAPPILALGIGSRRGEPKDTLRNAVETKELVVNLVPESLAEAMVASSGEFGPDEDEFDVVGIRRAASVRVAPPRVAEAPVAFECVLWDTVDLDRSRADPPAPVAASPSTLVLAEVVHVHVSDDVIRDDGSGRLRIDPDALALIARLGGVEYARRAERFTLERPTSGRG